MAHNPTEHVQEEVQHHANHGAGEKWITAAATTAAILAAFAAGVGALATHHLTQSTLIRIKANDYWNYYQAKSIKSSLLDEKIYTAQLNGAEPRKGDLSKKTEYTGQIETVQNSAREMEKLSREHLETHEIFEGSATLFHIAIAVVAISVVAKRREFWYLSMVGGAIGLLFFAKGYLSAPHALKESEPPASSQSGSWTSVEQHESQGTAAPERTEPRAAKGASHSS